GKLKFNFAKTNRISSNQRGFLINSFIIHNSSCAVKVIYPNVVFEIYNYTMSAAYCSATRNFYIIYLIILPAKFYDGLCCFSFNKIFNVSFGAIQCGWTILVEAVIHE